MGINKALVKNIMYTSALFHDVGRFYQGAFYNKFDDAYLKNGESLEKRSVLNEFDIIDEENFSLENIWEI